MEKSQINYFEQSFQKVKDQLEEISPTMCLAKWKQTTLNLHTGTHASCCLANSAKIPKEQLKTNPAILHNTPMDIEERKLMLEGNYPLSCKYCWKQEINNQEDTFSERINKSKPEWAQAGLEDIKNRDHEKLVSPTYLEVSFSNNCNFKCIYCYSHTSSTLNAEIKKHGPYPDRTQVGTSYVEDLYNGFVENPYSDAFWQWLPQIYQDLQTLRVTGGEPLLDKNLFKIFDYIIEKPNPGLELSINTNLGIDTKIVERMIENIKLIPRDNYKNIVIVSSLDCGGDEVEYIRYGLEINLFKHNMNKVLTQLEGVTIRITSTITLLAVTSLSELLDYVMELKTNYPKSEILLTPYPIINPSFLSLANMNVHLKRYVYDAQIKMQTLLENQLDYVGFNDYEIKSFSKIVENMESEKSENELLNDRCDFYFFIKEYDQRKKTSFNKTFPEHQSYMATCENAAQDLELELREVFDTQGIIEMINALKNIMRLHNVNIDKLFAPSLKKYFSPGVLNELYRMILSLSSKNPFFTISKFNDEREIQPLSQRSWVRLLKNIEYSTLEKYDFNKNLQINFYNGILKLAQYQEKEVQDSLFIVYFKDNPLACNIISDYFGQEDRRIYSEFDLNLILFYVKTLTPGQSLSLDLCLEVLPKILLSKPSHSKLLDLTCILGKQDNIDQYYLDLYIKHLKENPFEEKIASIVSERCKLDNNFKDQWFNIVFRAFSKFPYHSHITQLFEKFGALSSPQYEQILLIISKYMRENPYDNKILQSFKRLRLIPENQRSLFIENWQSSFKENETVNKRYWDVYETLTKDKTQQFSELLGKLLEDIYNKGLIDKLKSSIHEIPRDEIRDFINELHTPELDFNPQEYCNLMDIIAQKSRITKDEFYTLVNQNFSDDLYNDKIMLYWNKNILLIPEESLVELYSSMFTAHKYINPELFRAITSIITTESTVNPTVLHNIVSKEYIMDMYNDNIFESWKLTVSKSDDLASFYQSLIQTHQYDKSGRVEETLEIISKHPKLDTNNFCAYIFKTFLSDIYNDTLFNSFKLIFSKSEDLNTLYYSLIDQHKYDDSGRVEETLEVISTHSKLDSKDFYCFIFNTFFTDIYNDTILRFILKVLPSIPNDTLNEVMPIIENSCESEINERLLSVLESFSAANVKLSTTRERVVASHFYRNPYSPYHIELFKKLLKGIRDKERHQTLVDNYFKISVNHEVFDDAHWSLYIDFIKKYKLDSSASVPVITEILTHDQRKHVHKAQKVINKYCQT